MTIYLSNRDGNGKTSEEGHYRFQTKIFSGHTLKKDDCKVIANEPEDMSVLISSGDFRIPYKDYAYTGWINTNEQVVVSTADPANPRIDTAVLYVDLEANTSPAPPDNPGVIKSLLIKGTPSAVPVSVDGSVIQAQIGVGNPYIKLAEIYIDQGATTISNEKISDIREKAHLIPEMIVNSVELSAMINEISYPVGSIYINAIDSRNPSTVLGIGTWEAFGAGRVPVGFNSADADFNSAEKIGGSKDHTHTLNNAAAQIGARQGQANTIGYRNRDIGDLGGSIYNLSGSNVSGSARSHNTALTGSTDSTSNIQPYVTVYMWKRVS